MDSKHVLTVCADTFGHAKANGNLLYSSIIVKIYVFLELDGIGPLKSMFSLSKGCVALIRWDEGGL